MLKIFSDLKKIILDFAAQLRGRKLFAAQPNATEHLKILQNDLRKKSIWGVFIPHSDAFLNEFVPDDSQRLQWAMGFTGSAGLGIVTQTEAFLFVDGRYVAQAHQEVTPYGVQVVPIQDCSPLAWIQKHVPAHQVFAYDPWLHPAAEIEKYAQEMEKKEIHFMALSPHPLDTLWTHRPVATRTVIREHPLIYSGKESREKRQEIGKKIAPADMVVLVKGDSICWLLNIRGQDIPFTPIPQAYAIGYANGSVDLFIHLEQITAEIRLFLGPEVNLLPLNAFGPHLTRVSSGKKVGITPTKTPAAIYEFLENATVIPMPDPCEWPKALKNPVEIQNIINAHHVDGLALTRFLYWVSQLPPQTDETEYSAAQKLKSLRQTGAFFDGLSFDTISAHGPNGAIVHYRPHKEGSRLLTAPALYLVDSGGQYKNGATTDVTRTIALGPPTAQQKQHYTRVLQGHINLAKAIFPLKTRGVHLDILARQALWEVGLDYAHGTGHGVGSYLAVHEGPQSISMADTPVHLMPGMILSNEPGYYVEGAYGIRLENLVLVVEKESFNTSLSQEKGIFLEFQTLTLAPFDRDLIDPHLLSQSQKEWLNSYHQTVFKKFSSELEENARQWLHFQTQPF